jgi:transposase
MAESRPTRFVGLDVHKFYLIAVGVDAERQPVYGPQRVPLNRLDHWLANQLTPKDAVVLEMSTNTWQLYDELLPRVQSVTVVHPPHLALITRAQVMNDQIAALTLARLHAACLIPPLWVPPEDVRETRALIAQRAKLVRLSTQSKNRLHAVLHRHHLPPPDGPFFAPAQRDWWLGLPVSATERTRIETDLNTLDFARQQLALLEAAMAKLAAADERVPLLIQLPGFSLIAAMVVLAAIGPIERFASAPKLVGYAGLGARVHESGLTHHRGRITKAGRRDLRAAMVEAAQTAANTHPHWQAVLARLEPRLGRNKAIVAIARKLLVAVWHVLTKQSTDRFAEPERVARKFVQFSARLGKANRPDGQTTAQYVRVQLDRLGLGSELTSIALGKQVTLNLPPAQVASASSVSSVDDQTSHCD